MLVNLFMTLVTINLSTSLQYPIQCTMTLIRLRSLKEIALDIASWVSLLRTRRKYRPNLSQDKYPKMGIRDPVSCVRLADRRADEKGNYRKKVYKNEHLYYYYRSNSSSNF
jgi:hypothetical protein